LIFAIFIVQQQIKENRNNDGNLLIHTAIISKNKKAVEMILQLYDEDETIDRTLDGK